MRVMTSSQPTSSASVKLSELSFCFCDASTMDPRPRDMLSPVWLLSCRRGRQKTHSRASVSIRGYWPQESGPATGCTSGSVEHVSAWPSCPLRGQTHNLSETQRRCGSPAVDARPERATVPPSGGTVVRGPPAVGAAGVVIVAHGEQVLARG